MLSQIKEAVLITGEGGLKFDALGLDKKENKSFKMLKARGVSAKSRVGVCHPQFPKRTVGLTNFC